MHLKLFCLMQVGCLTASAIFSCHRYLKERLASLWREKLTKQLHRRYFHAMGYYKLSHLNNQAIPDVSERMVKDPRRFTKALADEVEKISAGITSGFGLPTNYTQFLHHWKPCRH